MEEEDKKIEVANGILFYMDDKIDQLYKEYGQAKTDKAGDKIKSRWPDLLIKMRECVDMPNLEMAKKAADEFFGLVKQEIVKSFN